MNTHVTVANTNAMVSELQHDVTNAHTIISDIHRTVVKIQEGPDTQELSVSVTRTPFVTE